MEGFNGDNVKAVEPRPGESIEEVESGEFDVVAIVQLGFFKFSRVVKRLMDWNVGCMVCEVESDVLIVTVDFMKRIREACYASYFWKMLICFIFHRNSCVKMLKPGSLFVVPLIHYVLVLFKLFLSHLFS